MVPKPAAVDFRHCLVLGLIVCGSLERDGPPVSPPERRGFGSTVIASMAKATVGGKVQLNYASSGRQWRLTSLATNAPELAKVTLSESK
jgi:hypothetical protein